MENWRFGDFSLVVCGICEVVKEVKLGSYEVVVVSEARLQLLIWGRCLVGRIQLNLTALQPHFLSFT
jgi:hypothetical protein